MMTIGDKEEFGIWIYWRLLSRLWLPRTRPMGGACQYGNAPVRGLHEE